MNLMKTFLLTFSLFVAGAVSAQAECKLPVQEEFMERFKSGNDQYNDRFYDDAEKIVEVLDTIVQVANADKIKAGVFSKEALERFYVQHKSLMSQFGKMYVYVKDDQMMLWVEDKEGCYMGHGKHHVNLWVQVKNQLEGL
jgi:ASC-1-like (ASCH) protein